MYLSLEWLKDHVDIPKKISSTELGTLLTLHTVEIDDVESQADRFKNIVVGKILEIKKHPKADKLQLAVVDVKTEKLNIVCGAPNIEVGQMVPVALVGAELPNGLVIKSAEIRGEKSHGMMCAEDELGLGEDHSGIMVLDPKAKLGMALSEHLKLDDVIFEVDNKSITNRPDLWCHYGMAREVATFLKTKFSNKFADYSKKKLEVDENKINLKVKIEDKGLCPRYMAVAMDNIKVEESPKWMQARLISAGLRPISNIVDITNYVMLELGQPMHAFDAKKISKKEDKVRIEVRRAKKDEEIQTLDGENRSLNPENLLIANEERAIAIAGVMGGEDSELSDDSTVIVLESANFEAKNNRKTSQSLGLRTEASQRFEKSQDPSNTEIALLRAVELIKDLVPGAKVVSNVVDENFFDYKEKEIEVDLSWLDGFIGKKIEEAEINRILSGLGFEPEMSDGILKVKVPSWRASKDISIKEDIAEEIARIYGYDNIEPVMPLVEMSSPVDNKQRKLERRLRDILIAGPSFYEVSNYSFVGEEQLKILGIDNTNYLRLANPISHNHTMLRQNLSTNLFDNVKTNQARFSSFGLFEIGSVYHPIEGALKKSSYDEETLPLQEKRLGILLAGNSDEVYLQMKSVISYLCGRLQIGEPDFDAKEKPHYWASEKYSSEFKVGDVVLGIINLLEAHVAKKMGIKKHVVVAELFLGELESLLSARGEIEFVPFEKFPSLVRDLAFIVDESISYSHIKNELLNFNELISRVELFDEYHGDKLGKAKKSLAFHIVYQAERTLESQEVDKIQSELIKHLENKFDAKIRDF